MPHQGVLETTMSNWLAHSLHWNRDYSTDGRSLINPTETEKFRSDLDSSAVIGNSSLCFIYTEKMKVYGCNSIPFLINENFMTFSKPRVIVH